MSPEEEIAQHLKTAIAQCTAAISALRLGRTLSGETSLTGLYASYEQVDQAENELQRAKSILTNTRIMRAR